MAWGLVYWNLNSCFNLLTWNAVFGIWSFAWNTNKKQWVFEKAWFTARSKVIICFSQFERSFYYYCWVTLLISSVFTSSNFIENFRAKLLNVLAAIQENIAFHWRNSSMTHFAKLNIRPSHLPHNRLIIRCK